MGSRKCLPQVPYLTLRHLTLTGLTHAFEVMSPELEYSLLEFNIDSYSFKSKLQIYSYAISIC